MKFKLLFTVLFLIAVFGSQAQKLSPIEGRWDLTVNDFEGKDAPSWLEIRYSGHATLIGRFVFAFGSARPIAEVVYDEANNFSFSIPRQWEPEGSDMAFEGKLVGEKLMGTLKYVDGTVLQWEGVRAPMLSYNEAVTWGDPIELFNGTNLEGWQPDRENNQWKVVDGILTNTASGANLISNEKFNDFKLHAEFRYPKGSNSGIYLRGRYEIQIEDNHGKHASDVLFGGVYGFLTPNEMVAKEAGEWQTYDVTLVGRRVTVVANGKTIIESQNIPGITGGALDSDEAEPGAFMIQGDHGAIEFRKFIVTPGK